MVVDRALDELQIEGEFDEETADDYPTVKAMMRDVLDHGEVHAVFADGEGEVEVRQGTATFDFDGDRVKIDDGVTTYSFAMDQVVQWQKPMNVYESES